MKFAQKTMVALFSLAALPGLIQAVPEDVQITLHLFSPIPQGFTQTRLFHMREKVAARVAKGEAFNAAYMVEVKAFLLEELQAAFEMVAQVQHTQIDAAQYAKLFLEQRLEQPFAQKNNGAKLFEQDPRTLPAFIFTYYVTPYLVPIFMREGIPAQTRDMATILSWAHTVYVGLDYVETFCEISKKTLESFGVKA